MLSKTWGLISDIAKYSAQIFLLGAEFTRAYAERHGSHAPEGQTDNGRNAVSRSKSDLHVSTARVSAERAMYRSCVLAAYRS